MIPVPARALAVLAGAQSHRRISTVSITDAFGKPVPGWQNLPVAEGSITADATSAVHRVIQNLRFVPPASGLPLTTLSPAAPYGFEMVIQSGIVYPDGSADMAQVGVFGIGPDVEQSAPGFLTLQGRDRAERMSTPLSFTYMTTAGSPYVVEVPKFLNAAVFPIQYPANTSSDVTTAPQFTFSTGDVPWNDAQDMAAAIGFELFMDPYGAITMRPVPNTALQPSVWVYEAGLTATFRNASRKLSVADGQQKSVSHAIALGASIDGSAPIRADSFDLDPASPTYWNGQFGDRSIVLTQSQYLTTVAQCQQAADALLRANQGGIEKVSFTCVPNPWHEAQDVVTIISPLSGTANTYVIESFTLPLGPTGEMQINTRARRIHP